MSETRGRIQDLEQYQASLRVCAVEAARQLRFLAEFAAADEVEGDGEFTHLEVAAVSGVSEQFARTRIELAQTLTTRLPRTLDALSDGVIDEYRARRMAQGTEVLSDEHAARVEDALIPDIHGWSPRQLNDRLRRAVVRVDPEAAAARAEAQRAARRVRHDILDDGAGLLQIQGDVERTHVAYHRMQIIARELKTAGDDRTLDQITADVALDCLAGKDFEHAKVHVWLTVPATTALGVDAQPGHLAGYGWLPAQRALELAAQEDAVWQRVLTDPVTGHAVDVGRRTYRPPAALRDHLRVRFPTCVGPGCRRPAHTCDLDHGVPFPTGPTDQGNVRPLCRRHHRAKTHGGCRIHTTPDNDTLTWITKHGYGFPYEPEPIAEPDTVPRLSHDPGKPVHDSRTTQDVSPIAPAISGTSPVRDRPRTTTSQPSNSHHNSRLTGRVLQRPLKPPSVLRALEARPSILGDRSPGSVGAQRLSSGHPVGQCRGDPYR